MRSAREITFRLRQELVNLGSWAVPPGVPADAVLDRKRLPDPALVAAGLSGTNYAEEVVRLAGEILAHRIPLLDRVVETGSGIDWRRDYASGVSSPARYFRLVPYLDIARVGDHKWIWELNRHQHLVLLAQAFHLTGREEFAAEVFLQLESWMDANPFKRGINWTSALEVAFRALSWIWVDHLLGARMNAVLYRRFLTILARHGSHLETNLSVYFSPNTHLLGEALALFALGVFYPRLPRSARWRDRGSGVMAAQFDAQVQPDGSHFEQSSYYHLYALDMFLWYYLLLDRPAALRPRLEQMAKYLDALAGPSRELPFLGDDDGGRLFHPYGSRHCFPRGTLAVAGVLLDRPEWTGGASDFAEIASWWTGSTCPAASFAAKPPSSNLFKSSGIARLISGDRQILVDAGPFGSGGAGHSHSDTLSLVARDGSEEILVDAGTFTYVGDPAWRNWFRGSPAHNTVTIDGLDQADPVNAFRWANLPQVSVQKWTTSAKRDDLDAACLYRGFTHRRRVLFRKPDLLFILDLVDGPPGDHCIEQFWHPGSLLVRLGPSCFQIGSRARLILATQQGEVEFGENSGYGWRSHVYGDKQPAPYLCWRATRRLPITAGALLDFSGRADSFTLDAILSEFSGGSLMPPQPVLLMTRSLDLGGSERQLTQIARSLDRRLFTPHVGCFVLGGVREPELRAAGVPIIQFPVTSLRNLSAALAARRLRQYLRDHRISLIHSFDTPSNIFAALWARAARVSTLLTSQRAHRELVSATGRRLLRLTDRRAHGIVVNCEFLRRHLADDEGVSPERIHLCYNGVDLDEFHPQTRHPSEGWRIGTICSLRTEKGLDTLLEAFAALSRTCNSARLTIVGHGPSLIPLQAQAQQLGIDRRVDFEPGTAEVVKWLHEFDIFVLPSRSEAFSNSLMEAMACGCPVVASRVGGNPELVNQDRGLLFPAGDALALENSLRQLIEHPTVRSQLASAGSAFIRENLSLAASARRMEQIYQRILSPGD